MSARHILLRIVTMAVASLVILPSIETAGQVLEVTEVREAQPQKEGDKAKEEKLSEMCLAAVKSYGEVKKRIDDRIDYIEGVAIISDLISLKEDMAGKAALPEKCSEEVGLAIDSIIAKKLKEESKDVDLEKVRNATGEMEAELMPEYLELSDVFDDVCSRCGKKPLRLAEDPLECRPPVAEDKKGGKKCSEAFMRYDNARDALMYRRDLCRQSAKIEWMDNILLWFQGRDDLPLTCAVQVKEFMDEMRSSAEGSTQASRYAFAVAGEKCGKALFPIYMRYGMSVQNVCEYCKDAEKKLGKDEMSCY